MVVITVTNYLWGGTYSCNKLLFKSSIPSSTYFSGVVGDGQPFEGVVLTQKWGKHQS